MWTHVYNREAPNSHGGLSYALLGGFIPEEPHGSRGVAGNPNPMEYSVYPPRIVNGRPFFYLYIEIAKRRHGVERHNNRVRVNRNPRRDLNCLNEPCPVQIGIQKDTLRRIKDGHGPRMPEDSSIIGELYRRTLTPMPHTGSVRYNLEAGQTVSNRIPIILLKVNRCGNERI